MSGSKRPTTWYCPRRHCLTWMIVTRDGPTNWMLPDTPLKLVAFRISTNLLEKADRTGQQLVRTSQQGPWAVSFSSSFYTFVEAQSVATMNHLVEISQIQRYMQTKYVGRLALGTTIAQVGHSDPSVFHK